MPQKPDPNNNSSLSVSKGVDQNSSVNPRSKEEFNRRSSLSVDEFVQGIREGNRMTLSRAITLIESSKAGHQEKAQQIDRKSTRLNSSHVSISYAVFCLKKKK